MGGNTINSSGFEGAGRLDPTQAGIHGNKEAAKVKESYVTKYGRVKQEIKDNYSAQTGRINTLTGGRLSEIKELKKEGNLTAAQKKMLSNYKKETLHEAKLAKHEIKKEYKEIKKDLKASKSLAKSVDKSLETMNRLFQPVGDDKPERVIGGEIRKMIDESLLDVSQKALSSSKEKIKNLNAMKKVSLQELVNIAHEKEKIDTEIDNVKVLHKELSEKYESTKFKNSANKDVVKESLANLANYRSELKEASEGAGRADLKTLQKKMGELAPKIELEKANINAIITREKGAPAVDVDKYRNIEKIILFGAAAQEIESAGTESEILVEEEISSGEGAGSPSARHASVKQPQDAPVKPFDLGADLSARFANFDLKPEASSTRTDQKNKINTITEEALSKLKAANPKGDLTATQKKMMSNFKAEILQEAKSAKKAIKNAEDFESVAKQKGQALEKTAGNFTRNLKIAGKLHKTLEESVRLHKQLSGEIAIKEFDKPANKAAAESGLAKLQMHTAKLKELEKAVKKAGSDHVEIDYQLYSDIETTTNAIKEALAKDKPSTIAGQCREELKKAQKAYAEIKADYENKKFEDKEKEVLEAKLGDFGAKINILEKLEIFLNKRAANNPLLEDELEGQKMFLNDIIKAAQDIEISVGELMKKGVDKNISQFDRLIQGKEEHVAHVYPEKPRKSFTFNAIPGATGTKAASFEETGGVKALHSMKEITKRIIENRDKLDIELLTYGNMPLDKNSPTYKAYNNLIVASDKVKAKISPIAERLAQIQPDENGKVDAAEIESLIKELASFYLSDEFTDLVRLFSQAGNLVRSEELDSGHSSIPEGRITSPQTAYAHTYQGMTRLVMPLKELLSEIPEGNTALFKTLENAFARTEELGYITNENIGNSKPLPFENYRSSSTTEER